MATKSASGLTKEERESFLRAHGYEHLRTGKGSHQIWEHKELKEIARSVSLFPPAYLLSNPNQKPWETVLPGDPASGTWHKIEKMAEWCAQQIVELKSVAEKEMRFQARKQEFRKNREDICTWKKSVKNWLKAGLAVAEAPRAPASYSSPKPS